MFDPIGQQKLRSPTFTTHAAAAAWRVEALTVIRTQVAAPKLRATIREAFLAALAGIDSGGVRTRRGTPFAPGTVRNLEADFRNHVEPYFGAARLDEIDRDRLQAWVRALASGDAAHLSAPLSSSAVSNCLKPLRLVFRVEAENDSSFTQDPFRGIRMPTSPPAPARAIPLVEFARSIDALPSVDLRLIYGLAGYAGLRLGEIQSLTRERVADTVIEVITGYDAVEGVRPRPKTPAGQRVVPIIPPLRALLDEHLKATGIRSGLLFPSPTRPGRALDKRAIHRRAKRAFEARELDFLRPHDARHCFGTYMGFAGVPSHTLRLVIGHTSIKTTDRYLHRLEEAALEAGSALSRYAAKALGTTDEESEFADLGRGALIEMIRDLRSELAGSRHVRPA